MRRSEVDLLLEVLEQAPHGLSRPELVSQLRQHVPHLQPADVERVVRAAQHRLRFDGNRFFAAVPRADEPATQRGFTPRRFVAFDLESIVRPIVKEPYREQHAFQIGDVRFGPHEQWCAERREFCVFTALPSEDELLIYRDELRKRYLATKRPLPEVLEEFRDFCASADTVVAYNGVGHDFRLIDEEYMRCGLEPLLKGARAPRLVDGLYLAQALWPIPPRQHRLLQLLKRLEIDVEEMQWHDALDDSKMLIELVEYGAREFLPTLGPTLIDLLTAASTGSDAWDLLFALADRANRNGGPVDHAETSQIVLQAREAQHLMVARLRDWMDQGAPALVEAPTGTGKSYALLAAALDWLDADDRHKVVISTYTKQLQSQLAADIEALTEQAIPELAKAADMVKGSANRLSLRALKLARSIASTCRRSLTNTARGAYHSTSRPSPRQRVRTTAPIAAGSGVTPRMCARPSNRADWLWQTMRCCWLTLTILMGSVNTRCCSSMRHMNSKATRLEPFCPNSIQVPWPS